MGCCAHKNPHTIVVKSKISKKIQETNQKELNNNEDIEKSDNNLSVYKSNDFSIGIKNCNTSEKLVINKNKTRKNKFEQLQKKAFFHFFQFFDSSELEILKRVNKNFCNMFIVYQTYTSPKNNLYLSQDKITDCMNKKSISLAQTTEQTPITSTTASIRHKLNNNNNSSIYINDNEKKGTAKPLYYDAFTLKPLNINSDNNILSPKIEERRMEKNNFDGIKSNGTYSNYSSSGNGPDGKTPSFAEDNNLSNNGSLIE